MKQATLPVRDFDARPRRAFLAVLTTLALVAALALAPAPALAAPLHEPAAGISSDVAETFRYQWKLSKFLGWIAGLFLPSRGEGSLTFAPLNSERLRGELLITSQDSEKGEYWSYRAEMDRETGRTLSAGSSYFYDGKQKSRRSEIEGDGVFDISSAIYLLRQDPPLRPRRIEVWSDGKVYPVVIQPRGVERRKVGEEKIATRHFTIEAQPGAKQRWKGKLELWIADDESATPVEIVVQRSGVAVRLKLADDTELAGAEPS